MKEEEIKRDLFALLRQWIEDKEPLTRDELTFVVTLPTEKFAWFMSEYHKQRRCCTKEDRMRRPFANGSQYMDWVERNCCHCKKYDPESETILCEIDEALTSGLFGDGNIDDSIATRMGLPDNPCIYTWDCPEKDLTTKEQ